MAHRTICGGCLNEVRLVHIYDDRYECPKCGAECDYDEVDDEYYWDEDTYDTDGDDEDYDDVYEEKPDCCRGCGGNYPDCMDSCEIFDD